MRNNIIELATRQSDIAHASEIHILTGCRTHIRQGRSRTCTYKTHHIPPNVMLLVLFEARQGEARILYSHLNNANLQGQSYPSHRTKARRLLGEMNIFSQLCLPFNEDVFSCISEHTVAVTLKFGKEIANSALNVSGENVMLVLLSGPVLPAIQQWIMV
jgi:hypothetical protein